MKIAMIGPIHPYRGGIAQYTAYLARVLSSTGHEVDITSYKRQYPKWLYPGLSDIDPSQEYSKTPAKFLLDPLYPWTWINTLSKINQFTPDLVIIQWWTTFWSIPYAFISTSIKKKNIQIIYIVHNALPHEQKYFDPLLTKIALRQGTRLIAHNPHEKDRLERLIPFLPVYLSPFPVYPPLTSYLTTKSEARSTLGLSSDEVILLFFGLVRPYKGLSVLIDALVHLRSMGISPLLIIAGEFWQDKRSYLNQIKTNQLNEKVTILDRYIPNEEADLLFIACDALIAPYIGGTQSAVAAQALGYGLPVVVTERIAAGVPEEYRPYIHVVGENDAQALANAIGTVIQNSTEYEFTSQSVDKYWEKLATTIIGQP